MSSEVIRATASSLVISLSFTMYVLPFPPPGIGRWLEQYFLFCEPRLDMKLQHSGNLHLNRTNR